MGRTEEWYETCARACNGLIQIGALYTQTEIEQLFDFMFNLKGSVSGRALWQLGTETVERLGADSLCNCFRGDTKFHTLEGIRTLKGCVGEQVTVLNHQGDWVPGVVKSFGKQRLWKLTLCGGEEIYCTQDHQWVPLINGQIRNDRRWDTRYLKGRNLPLVFTVLPDVDWEGFAHGVVYGDGTIQKNVREPYAKVELYGHKADLMDSLLAFGDSTTHHSTPTVIHLPAVWKQVPQRVSRSYALGFVLGLISTDGNVRDSIRVHSADHKDLILIRELAQYAGLKTCPIYCDREISPYDGSFKPCWCFSINTWNLKPSHFVRRDQQNALQIARRPLSIGVKTVEPTNITEEVFCLEVPGDHNFTLANGLLTGNCWLVTCHTLESFCFAFNQLMLGGGVGFNILPEYVYELPPVKYDTPVKRVDTSDCDLIVPDNREGWVDLLRRVFQAFFVDGKPLRYSTQCVRSAGKPIHSFGGVASGSEPLVRGIEQIVAILRKRAGQKLRPIDCLDIGNIIGVIVVSGNVRRSAEIMIGDAQDLAFLNAKNWNKHSIPNWRKMSNNAVACESIDELPLDYWEPYKTNGECYGLININNCRQYGRLIDGAYYRPDAGVKGCNPCGEANIEDREPCNLAEIFLPRVKLIGEFQTLARLLYKATKTIANYHYLDPQTEEIVHRNMRVGISVSGCRSTKGLRAEHLSKTYLALEQEDREYSKLLGVPTSVKLTCVKPSGTLSLLPPGISAGMSTVLSRYLIRRIRFASNDRLVEMCRQSGYHVEPELNLDNTYNHDTTVVEFPMDYGPNATTSDRVDVINALDYQRMLQTHWSDQSISCTHYFDPDEVESIQEWLACNYQGSVKTCSFMHSKDHGFKQAPLESITEEEYNEICERVTPIKHIADAEEVDLVDSLECDSGVCPVR